MLPPGSRHRTSLPGSRLPPPDLAPRRPDLAELHYHVDPLLVHVDLEEEGAVPGLGELESTCTPSTSTPEGDGGGRRLHAQKSDDVRVIQPRQSRHLLASRVHDNRGRDLDRNTWPKRGGVAGEVWGRGTTKNERTLSSLHVLPQTHRTVSA